MPLDTTATKRWKGVSNTIHAAIAFKSKFKLLPSLTRGIRSSSVSYDHETSTLESRDHAIAILQQASEMDAPLQIPKDRQMRKISVALVRCVLVFHVHMMDLTLIDHVCFFSFSYLTPPPRRRSVEDDLCNGVEILDMLKIYYKADEEDDIKLVSNRALLERESLRFNTRIRALLDMIWDWTDVDNSGNIDEDEYISMFLVLW
jgi:hypothetical protein